MYFILLLRLCTTLNEFEIRFEEMSIFVFFGHVVKVLDKVLVSPPFLQRTIISTYKLRNYKTWCCKSGRVGGTYLNCCVPSLAGSH